MVCINANLTVIGHDHTMYLLQCLCVVTTSAAVYGECRPVDVYGEYGERLSLLASE